jgi:hypothetical protein
LSVASFPQPGWSIIINPVTGFFATAIPGQVLADPNPKYRFGITNTLTYKIFTLSALVDYKDGGDLVSFTAGFSKSRGTLKETAVNREQPRIIRESSLTLPIINMSQYHSNPLAGLLDKFRSSNDLNVYDATVFRFRELALSVNIPSDLLKKVYLTGARFSVFARNLFYVAPNCPLDPEVNTAGAGNIQGLELQSTPNTGR